MTLPAHNPEVSTYPPATAALASATENVSPAGREISATEKDFQIGKDSPGEKVLPVSSAYDESLCRTRGDGEDQAETLPAACLPFSVALATERLCGAGVESAIRAALPLADVDCDGRLYMALMKLVQYVQSLPQIAGAGPDDIPDVLGEWYGSARGVGRWPFAQVQAVFRRAWRDVECPVGQRPIDQAWREALAMQAPPSASVLPAKRRAVASLCVVLQRRIGDGAFILPCRTLAELTGANFGNCAEWMRRLVRSRFVYIARPALRTNRVPARYRCPSAMPLAIAA
jgi:hypothetical protein